MARNLKLEVILNAVDRATRPLRAIDRASSSTSQALRENRERLKQLQATQKNVDSFRTLARQSTNTTSALREQQERIRRLSNQLRSHEGDSASLRAERAKAISQARTLTRRADEERQKLQRLRSALNENGFSTAELARDQRRLTTDMRQATHAVEEQQRRLKRLAEQQRNTARARGQYDRTMGIRNQMAGTGAGMMASGGASLYAGVRLLAPGVSWAEQMSTLQAVGRFTADDERYQALREQSRELGGSTAFSATEVGAGQEFLLRAGMSSDAIRASMRDVLDLALANNTELGRAADIASNIAGAFKIDLEADGSMARVADILSGTASRANVNLEMLGETMKYLGGAEDLKLTMEQAAAMSGVLGNIGIQGSQAGTTMRAMMNRLTNPAAAGAAAIENIGLQVADANGNMRAMPDILRDISQATADLGNVERKSILQDIFGAEAGSGMAELVNSMGAGELDALLNALGENRGENARMAATMADNIGGDLKNLRSAWEEIGISITDSNDGPLRSLIQNVTAITRGVGQWIKDNPKLAGTIAKVAGTLAVLATAGGAITLMLASILGPIAMVRFGLAMVGPQVMMAGKALMWLGGAFRAVSLFFIANPIGLAIAAIAGAAYLIYRYWEPIKAFFQGLWQQVKNAFGEGLGSVTRLLVNWSPLGLMWAGISSALGRLGIELPGSLTELGGQMMAGLSNGIFSALGRVRQEAANVMASVSGAFDEGLSGVTRLLVDWSPLGLLYQGMARGLAALGIELPERFSGLGGAIIDGLLAGLRQGLSSVREMISNLANGIGNWFKDLLGIHSPSRVFEGFGINLIEGLINGISGMIGALRDRIMGMAGQIAGWMRDAMGSAVDALGDGVGQAIQWGRDTAAGMGQGIREGASRAAQSAADMASGVTDSVRDFLRIRSPSRVFAEIGSHTVAGLNRGLDAHRDEPARRVADIAKRVTRAGTGIALGALTLPAIAAPDIPTPHLPDLPALRTQIERPALPDLGTLQAPGIELPAMPDLPAIELPALPSLGTLQAPRIALPAMPDLPALRTHIERPALPDLGTLQASRVALPAMPDLPALRTHIERPALPELPPLLARIDASRLRDTATIEASVEPIQFDTRPPLNAASAQPSGGLTIEGGININVTSTPGMDERQLAQYVAQEVRRALDDAQRDAQARQRSSMWDLD